MKKLNEILIIFLFVISFEKCILPFSNKNVSSLRINNNENSHEAVRKKITGDIILFSMLPTGDEPDLKNILIELMKENYCKTLVNIETNYYQRSFILFGFPILEIEADCVKGTSQK